MNVQKVKCPKPDILAVKWEWKGKQGLIVLVYMDVKAGDRNNKIYEEAEKLIERQEEGMPMLIMGDFNAHVGFLGRQELDSKGRRFLEFVEKNDLSILNCDGRCEGEYTRIQGENKSLINFMLVNEEMSRKMESMIVDEEGIWFDMSDHVLLEATFTLEGRRKDRGATEVAEVTQYLLQCKEQGAVKEICGGSGERVGEI